MEREAIIRKLNATDKNPTFRMGVEEIEYILRNWIEMHTRHAVENLDVFVPTRGMPTIVCDVTVSNTKNVQH
jgi:hypothetical protein